MSVQSKDVEEETRYQGRVSYLKISSLSLSLVAQRDDRSGEEYGGYLEAREGRRKEEV